jgi:hypothetical protein
MAQKNYASHSTILNAFPNKIEKKEVRGKYKEISF